MSKKGIATAIALGAVFGFAYAASPSLALSLVLPAVLVLRQIEQYGWVGMARGLLTLVLFFAAAALVAQVFFGQLGQIAQQFPVSQSNPFYNTYQSLVTALNNAMQSLSPLFTLIVAVIAVGLIWMLIRIL